jgi:hypothetical protein
MAVGDFNGDGKPDLAVTGGVVGFCSGNGDGTFNYAVNFLAGTDPVSLAVGDFNLDGKPDVAVANQGSHNVTVLTNTTH